MPMDREAVNLRSYVERTRGGPCFIRAFLAGHPDYPHETVFEDEHHVAFLDRWPTLPGCAEPSPSVGSSGRRP